MEEHLAICERVGSQRLPAPAELCQRLPRPPAAEQLVQATRTAIRDLLGGRDRRLLVVVGPCSIHDAEAALEYGARLREVARRTRRELVIVMRTYFEKPRTTLGWKGLLHDPFLDGSGDVSAGLALAREVLLGLHELGVPCGSELLQPLTRPYLEDLLSWVAIGARTCESATHREMASGLAMPVGFKNGTDGDLASARDGVIAAAAPHSALGVSASGELVFQRTRGNPDCHLVLRGGRGGPNYGAAAIAGALELASELGLARPLLVDCSHANSGKDPERQIQVCHAVLDQIRAGQRHILGLMLESHLHGGSQPWLPGSPLAYGVSITDPCLGWKETESLLFEIAEEARRQPVS